LEKKEKGGGKKNWKKITGTPLKSSKPKKLKKKKKTKGKKGLGERAGKNIRYPDKGRDGVKKACPWGERKKNQLYGKRKQRSVTNVVTTRAGKRGSGGKRRARASGKIEGKGRNVWSANKIAPRLGTPSVYS